MKPEVTISDLDWTWNLHSLLNRNRCYLVLKVIIGQSYEKSQKANRQNPGNDLSMLSKMCTKNVPVYILSLMELTGRIDNYEFVQERRTKRKIEMGLISPFNIISATFGISYSSRENARTKLQSICHSNCKLFLKMIV